MRDAAVSTGPIAVTGAGGHVGAALLRRLAGLEVRPLGRRDDVGAAVHGARVVVHLAGTLAPRRPDTYESANVATAKRVADAIASSSVARVVMLSYAEAGTDDGNAYLAAKARAEQLLQRTGRELVVLRSTYVYGPAGDVGRSFAPYISRDGRPVTIVGPGSQRIAPVFVDDVAEAIAAALEPSAPIGTFSLAGPETLTLDAMVDVLNGGATRKRHLRPAVARVLARVAPALNSTLVDVLLRDCLPHDPPAAGTRRSPRDVYVT